VSGAPTNPTSASGGPMYQPPANRPYPPQQQGTSVGYPPVQNPVGQTPYAGSKPGGDPYGVSITAASPYPPPVSTSGSGTSLPYPPSSSSSGPGQQSGGRYPPTGAVGGMPQPQAGANNAAGVQDWSYGGAGGYGAPGGGGVYGAPPPMSSGYAGTVPPTPPSGVSSYGGATAPPPPIGGASMGTVGNPYARGPNTPNSYSNKQ